MPDTIAHTYNNDEIDLFELTIKLWNEKWVILGCCILMTLAGIAYLSVTPPTYKASAQILAPLPSELIPINNTQIITISPTEALSSLLTILESNAHKALFVERETTLLAKIYNKPESKIQLEDISFDKLYSVSLPDTKSQDKSIEPDIITISSEGENRALIKELIDSNVALATKQLIERWQSTFAQSRSEMLNKQSDDLYQLTAEAKKRRENTITRLTEDTLLKTKKLQDELLARKHYVLSNRSDRIIELQEALKIATSLNIVQPSTLSKLSNQPRNNQQIEVTAEIRNLQEPLYLRGTKLLTAELESLENLSKDTLLDTRIIEIEAELKALQTNRDIEILENRKSDIAFNEGLQSAQENINRLNRISFPENFSVNFQDTPAISSAIPIGPKKIFILATSIIIGGMIGFIIAIIRIARKSYQAKKLGTNEA